MERTISALRGEGPEAAATEEPLVTVVGEVDCFDVGLRADLAEQHPALMEWLIAELADRDGVVSVQRYGPPRWSWTSRPGTSCGCGCG
ncbi:hypothetical protein [Kocuria sabuli]|uniref:hypothetical protein n=1 Tax=Kocuria sabuli TaxID=3071448 RepID=UPI0034D73D70